MMVKVLEIWGRALRGVSTPGVWEGLDIQFRQTPRKVSSSSWEPSGPAAAGERGSLFTSAPSAPALLEPGSPPPECSWTLTCTCPHLARGRACHSEAGQGHRWETLPLKGAPVALGPYSQRQGPG